MHRIPTCQIALDPHSPVSLVACTSSLFTPLNTLNMAGILYSYPLSLPTNEGAHPHGTENVSAILISPSAHFISPSSHSTFPYIPRLTNCRCYPQDMGLISTVSEIGRTFHLSPWCLWLFQSFSVEFMSNIDLKTRAPASIWLDSTEIVHYLKYKWHPNCPENTSFQSLLEHLITAQSFQSNEITYHCGTLGYDHFCICGDYNHDLFGSHKGMVALLATN